MITLIVATDVNGAIGKNGDIPWSAPEDLAFFSRETRGGAIIMGRKTWESLPVRPLKNRLNIVVSSDKSLHEYVVSSVTEAIELAEGLNYARLYGVGGAKIYQDLMPHAHRLLITQVNTTVDAPDTYFPSMGAGWRMISQTKLRTEHPACIAEEYIKAVP